MYKMCQSPRAIVCGNIKFVQQVNIIRDIYSSTHYDILRLKSNCTEKEIRDAFTKLSKEYHPDTSTKHNTNNTEHFQKILEAYRILSKSDTRCVYDSEIAFNSSNGGRKSKASWKQPNPQHPDEKVKTYHYDFTSNRDPNPASYYGIDGMKKMSNLNILLAIILFAGTGVLLQAMLIRKSMTFSRARLDEKSVEAAMHHSKVRANAQTFSTDHKIIELQNKSSDIRLVPDDL